MTETSSRQDSPNRVVCKPARDPAVRWFIMAAILIGVGLYCAYDAFLTDNYPYASPGEDINVFGKWLYNNLFGVILPPIGLIVAIMAVAHLRRVLVADQGGIGYEGKERIAWGRFQPISADAAKKLKEKRILDLEYDEDDELVLDSWKLQNFKDLIAFVEEHIPAGAAPAAEDAAGE